MRRLLGLYKWYTSFSLLYTVSVAMFFIYIMLYDRFLIEGESLVAMYTSYRALLFLLRCTLSLYEPFIFYLHAALVAAFLTGYEAEEGYTYVVFTVSSSRALSFTGKIAAYLTLVVTPPLTAKILLVTIWAPGLILRNFPDFLAATGWVGIGLLSAALIAFPVFALLGILLGRPSYVIAFSTVYLYLFESPFSSTTINLSFSLSRSYILLLVSGPAEAIRPLCVAVLLTLAEAMYIIRWGEVKWR